MTHISRITAPTSRINGPQHKANNDAFLVDLTVDEGRALETLSEAQRAKDAALGKKLVAPAPAPVTAQQ
jgi:hypothetical protein